jgi:hypothetical protein
MREALAAVTLEGDLAALDEAGDCRPAQFLGDRLGLLVGQILVAGANPLPETAEGSERVQAALLIGGERLIGDRVDLVGRTGTGHGQFLQWKMSETMGATSARREHHRTRSLALFGTDRRWWRCSRCERTEQPRRLGAVAGFRGCGRWVRSGEVSVCDKGLRSPLPTC